MADNDWKSRLGVVFSTNPDFRYESEPEEEEAETLEPSRQKLLVGIDRRNRGGKQRVCHMHGSDLLLSLYCDDHNPYARRVQAGVGDKILHKSPDFLLWSCHRVIELRSDAICR